MPSKAGGWEGRASSGSEERDRGRGRGRVVDKVSNSLEVSTWGWRSGDGAQEHGEKRGLEGKE